MKKIIILSLLIGSVIACKTQKPFIAPPSYHSDSTHVSEKERWEEEEKTDSASFDIPEQKASSSGEDSSFLENEYAYSNAWSLPGGEGIYHDLNLKPQTVNIEYKYVERIKYVDRFVDRFVVDSIPYPVEVIVWKEKSFNKWQRVLMDVGLGSIIFMLCFVAWKIKGLL